MASSKLIEATNGTGCRKDGSTYYLSKSVIKVQIHEFPDPYAADATKAGKNFYIKSVAATVKQDRRYAYCLDYLGSPTSDDTFIAQRSSNLLLQQLSSFADDKSKEIGRTLIRTLFVGLSRDPLFGSDPAKRSLIPSQLGDTKRFEVEYDPFDEDQTAVVNDALREFGFCLVLEHRGFQTQRRPANDYCDAPLHRDKRERHILAASVDKPVDAPAVYTQGVFYRPRLPYNYLLFVKTNRQAAGGWELRGTETVMFENATPVFSVAINRTFFAKRQTRLVFDSGVLRDVEIQKGSELFGFVQLPLQVAQSVAALPTSILQVRIDQTNNRNRLIQAQQSLLKAHSDYLSAVNTYDSLQARAAIMSGAAAPGPAAPAAGLPDVTRSLGADQAQTPLPVATGSLDRCNDECRRTSGLLAAKCPAYCQCKVSQCLPTNDEVSCHNTCVGLLGGG